MRVSFLAIFALISLHPAHGQQEQKLTTHVTLSATTAEGTTRNGATFSVQVAGAPASFSAASSMPTGSVSFMSGEQSIGAAFLDGDGHASITLAALPAGERKITAVYVGDDNFKAASSEPATVHAEANGVPSFALSASNSSLSVTAGQDVSIVITATPANGFNQAVSLSCSGVPYANTTCVFSPAQVTPGAATTANPNGVPAISTLSILTTAYTGGELHEPGFPGTGGSANTVYAIAAPGILALAGLGLTRRRWLHGKARGAAKVLSIVVLLAASGIGLSSCSQRYHYFARPPEGNLGTPAGTYTVVVSGITGTGSSLSTANVSLTLTVK